MDMQMTFRHKLPTPDEIKAQLPMTEEMKKIKDARDLMIADILSGKSDKILLIIGPCSADRTEPVLEYISRLARVQ